MSHWSPLMTCGGYGTSTCCQQNSIRKIVFTLQVTDCLLKVDFVVLPMKNRLNVLELHLLCPKLSQVTAFLQCTPISHQTSNALSDVIFIKKPYVSSDNVVRPTDKTNVLSLYFKLLNVIYSVSILGEEYQHHDLHLLSQGQLTSATTKTNEIWFEIYPKEPYDVNLDEISTETIYKSRCK